MSTLNVRGSSLYLPKNWITFSIIQQSWISDAICFLKFRIRSEIQKRSEIYWDRLITEFQQYERFLKFSNCYWNSAAPNNWNSEIRYYWNSVTLLNFSNLLSLKFRNLSIAEIQQLFWNSVSNYSENQKLAEIQKLASIAEI